MLRKCKTYEIGEFTDEKTASWLPIYFILSQTKALGT
jgi:hypothetical protein